MGEINGMKWKTESPNCFGNQHSRHRITINATLRLLHTGGIDGLQYIMHHQPPSLMY